MVAMSIKDVMINSKVWHKVINIVTFWFAKISSCSGFAFNGITSWN